MTSPVNPQASETTTPILVAFDPAYESPAARRQRMTGASRAFREGLRSLDEERDAHAMQRAQLNASRLAMSAVYTLGGTASSILASLDTRKGVSPELRRAHMESIARRVERALATNLTVALSQIDPSRVNAIQAWRESDTHETRRNLIVACLEMYREPRDEGPEHDATWTQAGAAHATSRLAAHETARTRARRRDDRTRDAAHALARAKRDAWVPGSLVTGADANEDDDADE